MKNAHLYMNNEQNNEQAAWPSCLKHITYDLKSSYDTPINWLWDATLQELHSKPPSVGLDRINLIRQDAETAYVGFNFLMGVIHIGK